jgi:hypothetical protein
MGIGFHAKQHFLSSSKMKKKAVQIVMKKASQNYKIGMEFIPQ